MITYLVIFGIVLAVLIIFIVAYSTVSYSRGMNFTHRDDLPHWSHREGWHWS